MLSFNARLSFNLSPSFKKKIRQEVGPSGMERKKYWKNIEGEGWKEKRQSQERWRPGWSLKMTNDVTLDYGALVESLESSCAEHWFQTSSAWTDPPSLPQPLASSSPDKTLHEERLCLDPHCNVFHMCSPSPFLPPHSPPTPLPPTLTSPSFLLRLVTPFLFAYHLLAF